MDKRFNEDGKKRFDFGVITYNQEDVVIQTLESIKYQIEKFGGDYECKLFVADDCSKDHTAEYCEKWIKKNLALFSDAKVIKSGKNRGTVENFLSVFDLIEAENYKIMDGDDVFSERNIFKLYEGISNNEIVTCAPFGIDERGQYKDVTNDYGYYSQLNNEKLLSIMEYQNLFVSGFIFLKACLLNDGTKKFMRYFRLLEDHSMYYEILMRTKAKIRFINEPYIFYRVRNTSVSHGSVVNSVYMDDCKKMTGIMLDRAKHPYARLYLRLKLASYKSRLVYLQPIRYWGKIVLLYRRIVSRKNLVDFSQEDINRELGHYKSIEKSAQCFLDSMGM